jgi:hypothetical protein
MGYVKFIAMPKATKTAANSQIGGPRCKLVVAVGQLSKRTCSCLAACAAASIIPDWSSVVLIVSRDERSPREIAFASLAAFLNS